MCALGAGARHDSRTSRRQGTLGISRRRKSSGVSKLLRLVRSFRRRFYGPGRPYIIVSASVSLSRRNGKATRLHPLYRYSLQSYVGQNFTEKEPGSFALHETTSRVLLFYLSGKISSEYTKNEQDLWFRRSTKRRTAFSYRPIGPSGGREPGTNSHGVRAVNSSTRFGNTLDVYGVQHSRGHIIRKFPARQKL